MSSLRLLSQNLGFFILIINTIVTLNLTKSTKTEKEFVRISKIYSSIKINVKPHEISLNCEKKGENMQCYEGP